MLLWHSDNVVETAMANVVVWLQHPDHIKLLDENASQNAERTEQIEEQKNECCWYECFQFVVQYTRCKPRIQTTDYTYEYEISMNMNARIMAIIVTARPLSSWHRRAFMSDTTNVLLACAHSVRCVLFFSLSVSSFLFQIAKLCCLQCR